MSNDNGRQIPWHRSGGGHSAADDSGHMRIAMERAADPTQPDTATDAGREGKVVDVVAWMHDDPKRVDVIHDAVKQCVQGAYSAAVQRPSVPCKAEHYTIPLVLASDLEAMRAELAERDERLKREAEATDAAGKSAYRLSKKLAASQQEVARLREFALAYMSACTCETIDFNDVQDALYKQAALATGVSHE